MTVTKTIAALIGLALFACIAVMALAAVKADHSREFYLIVKEWK